MAKFVVLSCEVGLEEFNLETLSKNEQPNLPIDIPLGIEAGLISKCDVYEVDENEGEENRKLIGQMVTNVRFDDGKAHFDMKISESLLGHPIASTLLKLRY